MSGIRCIPVYMKERIGQVVLFLLGLVIVIAAVAVAGALFVLAIRAGSTFGAALIAAMATVGAAVVLRSFERRKVMEEIRRQQLTETYAAMAQVLHGRTVAQEEQNDVMLEFMQKSLLYASAKTIKAFSTWSTQMPDEEETDLMAWRASSLRYEGFVRAMRDDLGIDNRSLQEGDLIRIGVDDFD
jgi:uncharacterized membrane protein